MFKSQLPPVRCPPPPPDVALKYKRWEVVCLLKKELEQLDSDNKMIGLQWESSWVKIQFLMKQLEENGETSGSS